MLNIKKIVHDYNKPKTDQVSEFLCRVKQLDQSEAPLEIKVCRESGGQWLLDEVCERLGGIQEKDYFGLRYTDKDKQRQWLDLGKNIHYQLKDTHPIVVSFRIKHYPASPLLDLKQDLACYYLYMQLRRDLYSGRLLGKSSDLYQLAAYAVQSQLSDFDVQNEEVRYISETKLLPNLNSKTEAKITEIHKTLAGLSPDEAETKFLEKACQLDTYGVEPFYVKDQKGNNLYVGLTHEGVSTFQGSRRAHLFKWADIAKIHYQGKLFIVQVFLDEVFNNQQIKKKHVLGFKCESTFSSAALWKWANDRMCFFSLNRSSEAKRVKSGGGIFKKRKTFRFAGRCQREIMQMSVSMMQINETGSIGLGRRNTLARGDVVQDEDYNQNKSKYNSMPSRDRGTLLGTQDTLDSLFIPNHPGSPDFAGSRSTISSPIGSPKPETKTSHVATQSLEHIDEEPQIVPYDSIDCHSVNPSFLNDSREDLSRNSSCKSSSQNLSPTPEIFLRRRLSGSREDIAGALEQLHLAVSDLTKLEAVREAKGVSFGVFTKRLLCLGVFFTLVLLLATFLATLFVALSPNYRNELGSYDYPGLLYDIVLNPSKTAQLVSSEQFSQIARNGYSTFSRYFSSAADKN